MTVISLIFYERYSLCKKINEVIYCMGENIAIEGFINTF